MWSAMKSMITAASIISRSASGSKIRPNSDSTCQRRARKPSIWSVIPAMPKTIPAAQLWPPSALSISATKTGIRASRDDRQRIRKLLQRRGNGTGRHRCGKDTPVAERSQPAGIRQRPLPRLPARSARPRRGRRLLGLAGADAGRGRAPDARARPPGVRRGLPGAARAPGTRPSGEFHYLGLDEALAAVEAAEEAGIRIVVLLAAYERGGLPRFRQESVQQYIDQVEELRGRGIAVGRGPALRARVLGRVAGGDRATTRPPSACRCMCTPTSSRARSRSASPSTASVRSSCSIAPAA